MIEWIKTSKRKPAPGKVVLGYWPTVIMQTVVYHDGRYWAAPGYLTSEKRNAPEYWSEMPDLPPGHQRGE